MKIVQFKESLIELLKSHTELSGEEIEKALSNPPDPSYGDVAFPLFAMARQRRKPPHAIAGEMEKALEEPLSKHPLIAFARANGPYLNFGYRNVELTQAVLEEVCEKGDRFGCHTVGHGQRVVIDFSSPNIAKPFGIGHLRSTVIGNAIRSLHLALGYDVVGINHLGDWGKQFGMLAVAYNHSLPQSEERLKAASQSGEAIAYFLELYVAIHRQAEESPQIHDEAREWFNSLERGDPDAQSLWKWFRELSLAEFNQVYDLLGIEFDYVRGESYYFQTGIVKRIVDELKEATDEGGNPLLVKSQDAWIVDLSEKKLGACLILKADGSTLYATRDIAGAVQRYEEFDASKLLYVVGTPQSLHFRQVFETLRKMGYGQVADSCVHVPFGLIRFKEGAMSTRKGTVVLLADVLNRAIEKVAEIVSVREDYTEEEKAEIARNVGIGAIVFADLSSSRIKDWDFNWEDLLSFEGRTGPYLMYTHARLASILRKYGKQPCTGIDYKLLDDKESQDLVRALAQYPQRVYDAAVQYEPSVISRYLLDLSEVLNRFYSVNRVVDPAAPEQSDARALLVLAVRQTLRNGLRLLGLVPPEKM